jgi:YggT family protein
MATERDERVRVQVDNDYEARERVVEYGTPTGRVLVSRISQLAWVLVGILDLLLVFRFVLKLVDAAAVSDFAALIYRLTDVFVSPFNGILGTPNSASGAVLDVPALLAIAVYTLVAWALIALFRVIFTPPARVTHRTRVERER